MKKVIIIGATSGIGKELAIIFAAKGFEVGITGRRSELLDELHAQLPGKPYAETMGIRNTEESIKSLFMNKKAIKTFDKYGGKN